MAAKDADLATDYFREFVLLTAIDTAQFAVEAPSLDASSPLDEQELVLTAINEAAFELELGPTGYESDEGIIYRMRATDDTLGYPVYWESVIVDAAGVDYLGPGPLSDVVVADKC